MKTKAPISMAEDWLPFIECADEPKLPKLEEIAEQYDISIDEMEVSPDHVHIFCSFPPRYSISQVVTRLKNLSSRAIFREFPKVKNRLWGGELWEDGYFARTVGDKVTAQLIRKYIEQHRKEKKEGIQLDLFK